MLENLISSNHRNSMDSSPGSLNCRQQTLDHEDRIKDGERERRGEEESDELFCRRRFRFSWILSTRDLELPNESSMTPQHLGQGAFPLNCSPNEKRERLIRRRREIP